MKTNIFACGNCGVAIPMPDCPSCSDIEDVERWMHKNEMALSSTCGNLGFHDDSGVIYSEGHRTILEAYRAAKEFEEKELPKLGKKFKCQCGADLTECYGNRMRFGVHLNPMGGE